MMFPFDDCKWESLGDYLRWKLGIPRDCEIQWYTVKRENGSDGQILLKKRQLLIGDAIVFDDITIERRSLCKYWVKRGFLQWECKSSGNVYDATVKVIDTLNRTPEYAESVLI